MMENSGFDEIDRAYFKKRAREEIEKAENCTDPGEKRERLARAAEHAQKVRALDFAPEDKAELTA